MDYTLAVSARHDDEVGVVSGDEEDGNAGEGKRRSEVDDSRPGLHAGRRHAHDDIGLF